MKQIILIRHTTPEVKAGICYGVSDLSLKRSFAEEADEIHCYISKDKPDIVYSSPLKRCTSLAANLYPEINAITDDRLKEINFGEWELKEWDKINRTEIDNWSTDIINIAPPHGENLKQLNERALSFFTDVINKQKDGSTIAIVTHSGIIRCLISHFLEIPLNKVFRLKLQFGCIVKIYIHQTFEEVEIIKNTSYKGYGAEG